MPRVYSTPGVYREEIDVSEILVPAGISNGGIVINSDKGPVNRPVLVTNDKEFIDVFGETYFVSGATLTSPLNGAAIKAFYPEYGYGSYAALEFLKESSVLYVVRNINDGDSYAGLTVEPDQSTAVSSIAGSSALYSTSFSGIPASTTTTPDKVDRIQNIDSYATGVTSEALLVGALAPDSDGNNIAVTVELYNSACDWANAYDNYTSAIAASAHTIASQVFKLNVFKKASTASWTDFESLSADDTVGAERLRITPVESFYGTTEPLLDGNKNQLYIEDVVNGNSDYIYVKAPGGTFSVTGNGMAETNRPVRRDSNDLEYVNYYRLFQLAGGDSNVPANAGLGSDQVISYALFENRENAAIGILIAPTWNTNVKQEVARIAASRADCIAVAQVADPTKEDNAAAIYNEEAYGYLNPSYMALYCGWSKAYDKYNDRFVYLPNAVYGAMLFARVDNIANPWDAPAGINRATLQVFDQRRILTFDEIGQIYDKNINSIRFIPGTGFVMWGQKTAQLKKSALDRINVRRNLLYIENNVEASLVQFIFENNTVRTRARVFSLIDPFLAQVKAGGGLTDYKLVVDETNNTADIIDANQMNVDIYVQPTRAIEFIQLRTIITRTGISFEEVAIA